MTARRQAPGYSDLQRVRAAIDRMAELSRLVEARMRAADGAEWMAARRRRLRKQGIRIRRDQRVQDPRVVLDCIAREEPLATVFSAEEREMARRLRTLANAAAHNDLGSLTAEDATWAEMTLAYRLPVELDDVYGLRLVLTVDGSLWLCTARRSDRDIPRIECGVHLDPARPRTYGVGPDWTTGPGDEEYVGDGRSGRVPFRSGWCPSVEGDQPMGLDDAITARVGALCAEHAIAWPEDDREAAKELAQARIAFLRDPPVVKVPTYPVRRRLAALLRQFAALLRLLAATPGELRRLPSWLAAPVLWAGVFLLLTEAFWVALLAAIAALGGVLRARQWYGPPHERHGRPVSLRVYLQGAVLGLLAFIALGVFLAVLQNGRG